MHGQQNVKIVVSDITP